MEQCRIGNHLNLLSFASIWQRYLKQNFQQLLVWSHFAVFWVLLLLLSALLWCYQKQCSTRYDFSPNTDKHINLQNKMHFGKMGIFQNRIFRDSFFLFLRNIFGLYIFIKPMPDGLDEQPAGLLSRFDQNQNEPWRIRAKWSDTWRSNPWRNIS